MGFAMLVAIPTNAFRRTIWMPSTRRLAWRCLRSLAVLWSSRGKARKHQGGCDKCLRSKGQAPTGHRCAELGKTQGGVIGCLGGIWCRKRPSFCSRCFLPVGLQPERESTFHLLASGIQREQIGRITLIPPH